jgi:hypothetical protein
MDQNEFETPAAAALSQFRDRVEHDSALSASIKAAVLKDLESAKPHAFERLMAALSAEVKAHEDRNA